MPIFPRKFLTKSSFGCMTVLFALPHTSDAYSTEQQYREAIAIAGQKVARVKAANAPRPSALSSPIIRQHFGRYYKIGDSWDVMAFQFDSPMARMTSDPDQLKMKNGRGGVFRYEVIEVQAAPSPQVVLKVTQLSEFGLKPVDSRVQHLLLTMNDKMEQGKKAYSIAGYPQLVEASPDSIHINNTVMDLFPLDVPETRTAEQIRATELPELPAAMKPFAKQTDYAPDLGNSSWLEQDDFFGRGVQMLWQKGDPWPAYMKTSQGVAILIRKRTS